MGLCLIMLATLLSSVWVGVNAQNLQKRNWANVLANLEPGFNLQL
jgi:hypothetical protein